MTNKSWFNCLKVVNIKERLHWLTNLDVKIDKIVNFGCWSGSEPFALIWLLNSKEIMVVESEMDNIQELQDQIKIISSQCPESLDGIKVEYLCADMTAELTDLPTQYYDLAYCRDVLYSLHIQGGKQMLDSGIMQMVKAVKLGGFIIAEESKFGVDYEKKETTFGVSISIPVPLNDPKDMTNYFSLRELEGVTIPEKPDYSYCYQKVRNIY